MALLQISANSNLASVGKCLCASKTISIFQNVYLIISYGQHIQEKVSLQKNSR